LVPSVWLNSLVSTINHERMPVLLTHEEEFETWLHGSAEEALTLAREYPPEQMLCRRDSGKLGAA